MELNDRRVLVTGAGGFIGSHLAERLVELGARTHVLVHYNATGTRGWLDSSDKKDKIEFVSGDICDRDSVTRAMRGVDVVFHLAALIECRELRWRAEKLRTRPEYYAEKARASRRIRATQKKARKQTSKNTGRS